MSWRAPLSWVLGLCTTLLATGCGPSRPYYFFEDGDLSHYKGVATEMEYPDVESDMLGEVCGAITPLTVMNPEAREAWHLSLEEAVQTALTNGKVMRVIGGQAQNFNTQASQSFSVPNQLLSSPASIQTIYNPALVESDPRFGVEGALSAFDAQFNTSMFWERNDRPVNLFFPGFLAPIFNQDLGTFRSEITKRGATGGTYTIRNNTTYEYNNNQSNRFPSAWNTDIEAEVRHPLLQGAGEQFNRIAGPNGVPGVNTGVAIARINTDIALADFEAGVRNLVSDVEVAYWRLYFAYRDLDAVIVGRDSALETWRKVYALASEGARGGEAEKEAQAREQYFDFRGQAENALSELLTFENRLRYLMGLAATDGRLIRPSDEPTTAKVYFDWCEVQAEGLVRSVELRRLKWEIKSRELELTASKNYLLPRLDAVGRYRWRGFGDQLLNGQGGSPAGSFDNAWETLADGDYQEWQLGLQLNVPIGFRQQLAGVRNSQLALARQRALLQDAELELSHQMSYAIRDLDRHYAVTQSNFNRRAAAAKQVEAVQAIYETGVVTLDLLLDAQRRLAFAESAYYRSLIDYNLAITQIHYRKGTLLEYNGVFLAEGPWPGKAYFDAKEEARKRDAALFLNYGFTRPNVFSRGPIQQHAGEGGMEFNGEVYTDGHTIDTSSAPGEPIATPEPSDEGSPEVPEIMEERGGANEGARLSAPGQFQVTPASHVGVRQAAPRVRLESNSSLRVAPTSQQYRGRLQTENHASEGPAFR